MKYRKALEPGFAVHPNFFVAVPGVWDGDTFTPYPLPVSLRCVTIIGHLYHDPRNGNHFFSARVTINPNRQDEFTFILPKQEGGGDWYYFQAIKAVCFLYDIDEETFNICLGIPVSYQSIKHESHHVENDDFFTC